MRMKQKVGDAKVMSMVKADAYGHGILPTAARLMQSGVDLFAVANVREAAEIREMASGWPILVLGPLLEEEDSALLDYELIATLSSAGELTRFRQLARERKRPPRSSETRYRHGQTWRMVGRSQRFD